MYDMQMFTTHPDSVIIDLLQLPVSWIINVSFSDILYDVDPFFPFLKISPQKKLNGLTFD